MLNKDCKTLTSSRTAAPKIRLNRNHWRLIALVSVGIGVAALLTPVEETVASRHPALNETDTASSDVDLPAALSSFADEASENDTPNQALETALPADSWQTVRVAQRDTLSQIFTRLNLDTRQMYAVLETDKSARRALTQLLPGETILFNIREGLLYGLQYHLSATEILKIHKAPEGYQATIQQLPVEYRTAQAIGTIDSSLFATGQQAGLSDNLIMQLVNIFGWDIDFALDIRSGDSFSVVYEERYINGKRNGEGEVIAAEFINQGHSFRAVRFKEEDGSSHYYTPEGASMRKAFLRTPVEFSRISSRFGGRMHPVKQVFRMHKGVDYAAPTGTPVRSTGEGKIVFRGSQGGYGNVVIVQHGGKYSTVYGHLSRFKSGLNVGSRVQQGQVIAYVGSTGMSTGPHLHYEFRVNGVHTNPLTVKLPNVGPVPEKEKARFLTETAPLIAKLDLLKRTQVAALGRNDYPK